MSHERVKLNTVEVLKYITESEQFKESVEEDLPNVGDDYLSRHSLEMNVISQCLDDRDFMKGMLEKLPELKKYLRQEFGAWLAEQDEDEELFESWLFHYSYSLSFYDSNAMKDLQDAVEEEYRKTITEVYKCEGCGREISEKWADYEDGSVHRVGTSEGRVGEAAKVAWHLYCGKCYGEKYAIKRRRIWH